VILASLKGVMTRRRRRKSLYFFATNKHRRVGQEEECHGKNGDRGEMGEYLLIFI
jgi:hypothetical protein